MVVISLISICNSTCVCLTTDDLHGLRGMQSSKLVANTMLSSLIMCGHRLLHHSSGHHHRTTTTNDCANNCDAVMKQLMRHTRAYDVGRLLHAALSVGALRPVGIGLRCDFVAVQLVSLAHLLRHLQHLA